MVVVALGRGLLLCDPVTQTGCDLYGGVAPHCTIGGNGRYKCLLPNGKIGDPSIMNARTDCFFEGAIIGVVPGLGLTAAGGITFGLRTGIGAANGLKSVFDFSSAFPDISLLSGALLGGVAAWNSPPGGGGCW